MIAHNEAPHPDTFAVTVNRIDKDDLSVNIVRVDSLNDGWYQNLRLDWIAWE